MEIYSQTATTTLFETCRLEDCDIMINRQNFMSFDFVRPYSSHRMKLEWDDTYTLEWAQSQNPLAITNMDMDVCANNGCQLDGILTPIDFYGLSERVANV